MAACALMACVDGQISLGEKVRVDQILETLDKLKVFDPHEGVDLFNEFADAILADSSKGRERSLKALTDYMADHAETGHLIMRICLAISEADGARTLADQIEIVQICSHIGVEPKDVGLYTDRSPDDIRDGKI